MSADSPLHGRAVGPLTVASQPPSDRTLIDTVSGFISDVTLASAPAPDARDAIQWARFETADINEPVPEGDHDTELSPLLLILGYGSGVQVWLIPPNGEAQEVMSWRQGTVRVLRILPTPSGADSFAIKRPLFALCDSASPGPLYCSLSFISIRGGDQVKSIKFKNAILDVLANKRSVVVSFSERFAVFDACTLEDRLAVTTCYPCPCPLGSTNPINPLALGDRWLAYADKKLNPAKRSSGGCEGEGVSSYTATVLHAAKSLSKGLRGLGESVASSLAGGRTLSQSPSPPNTEHQQPGVLTVVDIEGTSEEDNPDGEEACDSVVAHFVAHSDAVISLKFDASGMLLVSADKRGHDFHVFRIHPHPCGSSLASVHHLYILHRGDTTAKVQDIAISLDSRWTAVSTLRGTTHVFPISPYGGACGVRTHTQPRVVNRLSRFHRSAGLPIQAPNARSSSPVGDGIGQGAWFPNPRLPPYPLPTTSAPLAQLRPTATAAGIPTHTITRNSSGRQRLSSLSEDTGGVPLLACARWGVAPPVPPAAHASPRSPAAHALYVMAATGHLLHYLIHPRHATGIAKEKVCDDTPLEVGVELVAQWPLTRPVAAPDMAAPLAGSNPLLLRPHFKSYCDAGVSEEERWLAQVEIVTHAGPHRRLWMGPQFVFKTYNATLSGSSSSLLEAEAVEVEAVGGGGGGGGMARSPPVNMPGARPLVPVLIDSGSASSLEHSPSDSFRRKSYLLEAGAKPVGDKVLGDVQLKEDLAEAMRDTEQGSRCDAGMARRVASVARAVDPLGTVVVPGADDMPEDDDADQYTHANADEALFRPVVRAPAALPPHPDLPASHLPAGTRIPVQNLGRTDPLTPDEDSVPLKSEVVIPAALTRDPLVQQEKVRASETVPRTDKRENSISPQRCSVKSEERISPQRRSVKKVDSPQRFVKKDDPPRATAIVEDDCSSKQHSVNDDCVSSLRSSLKKDDLSPQSLLVKKNNISPQRCSVEKVEKASIQRRSVESKDNISPVRPSIQKKESVASQTQLAENDDTGAIGQRSKARDEESVRNEPSKKEADDSTKRCSVKKEKYSSPQRRSTRNDISIEQSSREKADRVSVKHCSVQESVPDKSVAEITVETVGAVTEDLSEPVIDDNISKISKNNSKVKNRDRRSVTPRYELKNNDNENNDSKVGTVSKCKDIVQSEIETSNIKPSVRKSNKKLAKNVTEEKQVVDLKYDRVEQEFVDINLRLPSSKYNPRQIERSMKDEESVTEDEFVEAFKSPKSSVTSEPLNKNEDQIWAMLSDNTQALSEGNATETKKMAEDIKPKPKKNKKNKKVENEIQEIMKDVPSTDPLLNAKEEHRSSSNLISERENTFCPATRNKKIDSLTKDIFRAKSLSPESSVIKPTKNTTDFKGRDELISIDMEIKSSKKLCMERASYKQDEKIVGPLESFDLSIDFDAYLIRKSKDKKSSIEPKSVSSKKEDALEELFNNSSFSLQSKSKKQNRKDRLKTDDFVSIDKFLNKDKFNSECEDYPPIVDSKEELKLTKASIHKMEDSEIVIVDTIKEDFPSIATSHNNRFKKRWVPTVLTDQSIPPPIKSYSSIAAVAKPKYTKCEDTLGSESVENILDPPKPCRTSLHDKLAELCKRTDIAVAECDAPDDELTYEEAVPDFHLPPLDFSLDEFNLEVMRDSVLDTGDKLVSPICNIDIYDTPFDPESVSGGHSTLNDMEESATEMKPATKTGCERMEKSSDDDNASPVSSQTDSDDKEDKTSAAIDTPPAQKTGTKKKARQRKRR